MRYRPHQCLPECIIHQSINAETAVVNVVREEGHDVIPTADQHVVTSNEKNVVDPLRNLDNPAMSRENAKILY